MAIVSAEINGHREVHSRLLTVRSLLRWAFNGVNVLEGRPMEEYAVQNPPDVGSRGREGAASTTSSSSTAGSARASSEEGQVKEDANDCQVEDSDEVRSVLFFFKIRESSIHLCLLPPSAGACLAILVKYQIYDQKSASVLSIN